MSPCLNDNFKLDSSLGPIIDGGPALMAKILGKNSQVLHWFMHHVLTRDEWGRRAKRNVEHS